MGRGLKLPRSVLSRGLAQGGASTSSSNREAGESNGWSVTRYDTLRSATRRREGSSRDSMKDYLHFLYIARGSLSETRYFIHLSGRLGYLNAEQSGSLKEQADECLRVLAGLIRSVESEAGKVSRTLARITSMLVFSFGLSCLMKTIDLRP